MCKLSYIKYPIESNAHYFNRMNIRNLKDIVQFGKGIIHFQKQPSRGALRKRCSKNMQ